MAKKSLQKKKSKKLKIGVVPSSLITSQITAEGFKPESRTSSILASVCPGRARTPAACPLSGNMCPGQMISAGFASGRDATQTVLERSAAEIPVVTPELASMLKVNAVFVGPD